MYKVRRKTFAHHADASKAAKEMSTVLPVHLKATTGGAWYWHGRYCGRKFFSIFCNN